MSRRSIGSGYGRGSGGGVHTGFCLKKKTKTEIIRMYQLK